MIDHQLKDRLVQQQQAQIQQLETELAATRLREQALSGEQTLLNHPVEGLLLAINAMGENFTKLPGQILPTVQQNLYRALELARESHCISTVAKHVNAIAWSPDGQILASGDSNGAVCLWDQQGKAIAQSNQTHAGKINSLAWHPEGQLVASGSSDGTIGLWDRQGQFQGFSCLGHDGDVNAIAWSPEGQYLASGSWDKTVRIWDPAGHPVGEIGGGHQGEVVTLAWSPDGDWIASGSSDHTIRLWRPDGTPVGEPLTGHLDRVNGMAFSPDSLWLVSGSWDKTLRLWKLVGDEFSHKSQVFQGHEDYVLAVAFRRDGRMIASGSSDQTIRLWDIKGHPLGAPLKGHGGAIRSLSFHGNGRQLASGSSDGSIRFWATAAQMIAPPIYTPTASVWSVAVSRNQTQPEPSSEDNLQQQHVLDDRHQPSEQSLLIVSSGENGQVQWWNQWGQLEGTSQQAHQGEVIAIATHPSDPIVASSSWDGTIRLWDQQGHPVGEPWRIPQGVINALAFSPDGHTLASASHEGIVHLWDYGQASDSPTPCKRLQGHGEAVNALAFSPDGQQLVSADNEGIIYRWDRQGEPLADPILAHDEPIHALAFSPDGHTFASASSDHTIRLWDGQGNSIAEPLVHHDGAVNAVVFSPDGQTLASASSDRTLHLWNRAGELIAPPFCGHESEVVTLAFMPDGQRLISGGLDGTIRCWRVGHWRQWLQVAGDRLQHHPVFESPRSAIAAQAYGFIHTDWQAAVAPSRDDPRPLTLASKSWLSSLTHPTSLTTPIPRLASAGLASLRTGTKQFQDRLRSGVSSLCWPNLWPKSGVVWGSVGVITLAGGLILYQRAEQIPLLCQHLEHCAQEQAWQILYDQEVTASSQVLGNIQTDPNLDNLKIARDRLNLALMRLGQIPDHSRLALQVQQDRQGFRQQLARIAEQIPQEEFAQKQLEQAEQLAQVARKQTEIAKTTAQHQQALATWQQLQQTLESIPQHTAAQEQLGVRQRTSQYQIQVLQRKIDQLLAQTQRLQADLSPPTQPTTPSRRSPIPQSTPMPKSALTPKPTPTARRPTTASSPPRQSVDVPFAKTTPQPSAGMTYQPSSRASARSPEGTPESPPIPANEPKTITVETRSQPKTTTAKPTIVATSPVATAPKSSRDHSIAYANDIAVGLSIAHGKGQIKHGTWMYRKVQTAIALLRRGKSRQEAARMANVPLKTMDQLIRWGQQRPARQVQSGADTSLKKP